MLMKLKSIFFILLSSFAFYQTGFGQEKSNAELFDNFTTLSCSEIRSRTDNFLMSLAKEPNSFGYVIFYGAKEPSPFSFYENAIKSHIRNRNFSESRVNFITANPVLNFKVEFWLSGNDVKSREALSEYNLILNSNKNRYIFTTDLVEISETKGKLTYFSECEILIESINLNLLAMYLKANPEFNAEIHVYNKKRSRGNQVIKLFLNEANKDYKIPLHRLKIGYAGIDEKVAEIYGKVSTVKIWLVSQ